jgi:hypothetical protein
VTRRAAYPAAVLVALAVSRLLPEHGAGLFVRLGAATLALLLPGRLIARALGLRLVSATVAWTLGALALALGVVFLVRSSFELGLAVLLVLAVGALVWPQAEPPGRLAGTRAVAAVGALLGLLLWRLAPRSPSGDTPFHLARVRKLVDLGSLTPWRLDELVSGGLHPGYAFPLWHAFLAAVTELAGVDPALVVRYESTLLAPLAVVVAYEAGALLFRSPMLGAAAAAAQVALIAFAPGHGGTYPLLVRPSVSARQIFVPAVLALVFAQARDPSKQTLLTIGAASLALALVHPTYALFLCLPLAGWLVVSALFERGEVRRIAASLGAVAIPVGAVTLALLPLRNETILSPETRHFGAQLVVHGSSYHLAPQVFGRSGAVAVAALVLVPLAALGRPRLWSSFVLGGSLAVLTAMLVPFLFVHLSDAVSLSQSRRAAGFLPYAVAFVGGLTVLARLLGVIVLPLALVSGIVLQLLWPGDFGYRLVHGGPAAAAWIAAVGGALALLAALAARRRLSLEGPSGLAALAAALFLLPVVVHGFSHWSTATTADPNALTPGLVRELRALPKRSVVFSDLQTSYRIAADAPVLIVAAPPEHVARTKANRPYERRRDVAEFYRTGDLAIPRRYGAEWLVIETALPHPRIPLEPVYRDARFALYRL